MSWQVDDWPVPSRVAPGWWRRSFGPASVILVPLAKASPQGACGLETRLKRGTPVWAWFLARTTFDRETRWIESSTREYDMILSVLVTECDRGGERASSLFLRRRRLLPEAPAEFARALKQ